MKHRSEDAKIVSVWFDEKSKLVWVDLEIERMHRDLPYKIGKSIYASELGADAIYSLLKHLDEEQKSVDKDFKIV